MYTVRVFVAALFLLSLQIQLSGVKKVYANDSEAELATGGLILRQSDSISLESEDLYISPDEIRVRYIFRNPTSSDFKTIVAFPLPDADYGMLAQDEWLRIIPVQHDETIFPFSTKVDGKAVQLTTELRAFIGEKEITAQLKKLQLPLLLGADRGAFLERVNGLPSEVKKSLLDDKIILRDTSLSEDFLPLWRTKITILREQVFPANKDISVEHTYSPITGGTIGNWRMPNSSDSVVPESYWKTYCIDDAFVTGVMKRINRARAAGEDLMTRDLWLSYILTSGANWAGPIKKFTLTVDKKSTDSQVSFCESNVVKISPTRFQVTKMNFTPSEDLKILFVSFSSF